MKERLRIIRHSESFEIRFPDGREPVYFSYEDEPTRRSFMGRMTSKQAETGGEDLCWGRAQQD
jgi:hypothetical protein